MKALVLYISLTALSIPWLKAQTLGDDCADALSLCGGNQMHFNNIGATTEICTGCADGGFAIGTFCYEVNNSVWFSFTTNSLGGSANVVLSNLSCLTGAGQDNQLQASVFSATTACDPSTYNILQCTGAFSGTTSLALSGLSPNTTYYVHVDGDDNGAGITVAAECDFDIEVNGAAVEPEINTTITPASCAGNDGQIVINSVTGGSSPFSYSLDGGAFQSSNTFTGLAAGTYDLVISSGNGCSFSDTVTVDLTGGPQDGVVATVDATCATADGQLAINGVSGGTSPYTYSLNGGVPQASNSFTGLSAGQYDVTVTDDAGCSFTYEDISVASNGSITSADFVITQPTCDTPTGTITVTPSGGTSPYTYSLNGGAAGSSNSFSGLAAGTYTIEITDDNGCTFEDNELIVEPATQNEVAQITISPSTVSICQGTSVTFNAVYSNGGSAPVLQWQVNGSNVGTGDVSFTTSSLNNGDVVTVILTSNDPCVADNVVTSNSVTATVTPQVNPTVTIVSDASTACAGETVTFTASTSGCSSDGTYTWYINGSIVATTATNVYSQPLLTTSEVVCTFLCNDPCSNPASSNSVDVSVTEVYADAGTNQVIGEGESTLLDGDGNGIYSWSPSATLSDATAEDPIASPVSTTTYTLTVTNNGCTATDDVTITVTELIIVVNTFSPNGDGINDTWRIYRIENFPACKVTIYDRWGQRVYNSTGYSNDNPWDGTYLNRALPCAAYYYVIELNEASTKEADTYYGWVSIIY